MPSADTTASLSKSFFVRSTEVRTRRLSSDWESTRLKIELSPVRIREAAFLLRVRPRAAEIYSSGFEPWKSQRSSGATDSLPPVRIREAALSSHQSVANEQEERTALGSSTSAGTVKHHGVVLAPRHDGSRDLIRVDVSPRHTAAIAKECLPGGLDDDREGSGPPDRPLSLSLAFEPGAPR